MSNATHPDEQGRGWQGISEVIGSLNCQRISRLAALLAPVSALHVWLFMPFTPGASDKTEIWRNGIIIAHTSILVVSVLLSAFSFALERKGVKSRRLMALLAGFTSLTYLLFGAGVAIIDQLVTAAVTPLLVASTGVAVVIVMSPAVAAVNYLITVVFFVMLVPLTQTDPDLLLSVRVNSMTAAGVGFGVAFVLWRGQVLAIRQKWQIEEQQRELQAKNQELTRLATQDDLTGLVNRPQFLLEANREIARIHRTGQSACLIMLDIDHFKSVNDNHGHPVGDSILRGIGQILTGMLRDIDTVARFGGEEFAILLPNTPLVDGTHVAERLRAAIAEHTFLVATQPVKVTASLGVATLSAEHHDVLDEGYRAADKALYQAKGDGRNCVRFEKQGERPRSFTH